MTNDITVVLRGGRYQLADTMRFDHRDSGMNGFQVIYRSFSGEHAELSGGHRITGWTTAKNGLAQANVGSNRFRQLYVNGIRATRARTPNAPEFSRLLRWDEATQQIVTRPHSIASWSDTPSVELIIMKQWTQNNLRVESFLERDEGLFIQPREPDRTKAFLGHLYLRLEAQSYYFENALELLDVPGEWYLRVPTEEVFYLPRGTEDLSQATVMAPHIEQLLDVRGAAGNPVHHLAFIGLTFEYAGWTEPSEEGFAVSQGDVIDHGTTPSSGRVTAAVNFTHAHHIQFERNTLQHLGGTGLVLHTGVTDVQVVGNRFRDLSGSGIVIDSLLEKRTIDPRFVCQNILIANNLITDIGLDYRSSIGIFAGFVSNTSIEHNDIHDTPYTGISVGWGWTDADTLLGANRIVGNRIYRVMTTMADGAGIYTLSKQSGTIIQDNYIYDLLRSPWAGNAPISAIYLDEGSSGITMANNALERVPLGIFLHRASGNTIVNTVGTYEERWGAKNNSFQLDPEHSLDTVRSQAGLEPTFKDLHSIE
ncbi:right-handed parallel beta-helix repeat-containing protein [Nitrospira lenta]|nr:right-handed parallel beta-helix repeat-containing protein [Nitrospira lenta]